jgi:tape measure domain-containing protein
MADIARLGFQIDTSPITGATAAIQGMGSAAAKAGADVAQAQAKIAVAGKQVEAAELGVAAATSKAAAEASKAAVAATGEQTAQAKLAQQLKQVEAAEARLAAETARATAAQAQAQAQIARTNAALTSLAQSQKRATEELVNLNQQFAALRGPVDQLRTAFGVLMAALGVNKLMDTAMQLQRVEMTLRFVTGTTEGAQKAFEDFSKRADMMGVGILEAAPAFAQFAAAAKVTGLSLAQASDVFTGVSSAMLVMGRSTNDVQGALYALQQILSKNKVMAEEVRLQFGERLPGGLALAAKALGMTSAQFNQAMESGTLDAKEFVTKVGGYLKDQFAPDLANSTDNATRKLSELENAWLHVQESVIKGGFGDAMISTLTQLTAALQSGPLVAGATALGAAFGLLAHNLDILSIAAGGFIALKLFNVFSGLQLVQNMATAFRFVGVQATAAAFAVRGLGAAMAFLNSTAGIATLITAGVAAFVMLNREVDYATDNTGLYAKSLEQANTLLGYIPHNARSAQQSISDLTDETIRGARATAQAALDEANRKLPGARQNIADLVQPFAVAARNNINQARSRGLPPRPEWADNAEFLDKIVKDKGPQSIEEMQKLFGVIQNMREEWVKLGNDPGMFSTLNTGLVEANKGFELQQNTVTNNTEIVSKYDSMIRRTAEGMDGLWRAQNRMEAGRMGGPGAMGDIQSGINAVTAKDFANANGAANALKTGGVEGLKDFNAALKETNDGTKEADRIFKAYQATIGITGTQVATVSEALNSSNTRLRLAAQASQVAAQQLAKLNAETDKNEKLEQAAVRIRDQATGGLSTLNKRLLEAQQLLASGHITLAEFRGELDDINSDGLDKYRAALQNHQKDVANSIKLQLIANATLADGLTNMGAAFAGMLGTVETAMQALLARGVKAGGILAAVSMAAQGAIDWAQSFLPAASTTTTTSSVDQVLKDMKDIQDKINRAKETPQEKVERTYAKQKGGLQEQIDGQNRLAAAYAKGSDAVRQIEQENARLAAIQELQGKKYTPDQIKSLTDLINTLYKAKDASEALRTAMNVREGIGRDAEDAQLSIRMVGASEQQVAVETRLLDIRRQLEAAGASKEDALAKAESFRPSIEGLEETRRHAKMLQESFDGVGASFTTFLTDLTGGTKTATESLQGLLDSLLQLANQQILAPALKTGFSYLGKMGMDALGISLPGSDAADTGGLLDKTTVTATTAVINVQTLAAPSGLGGLLGGGIPDRPDLAANQNAPKAGIAGGSGFPTLGGGVGSDTLETTGAKLAGQAATFTDGFSKTLNAIGMGMQQSGSGFLSVFGQALQGIVQGLGGGNGGGILGSIGTFVVGMFGGGSTPPGIGAPGTGGSMAAAYHTGGIVGTSGGAPRRMAMSWDGAPKLHGGGIIGLAQDEVRAVLKRKEEVITPEDARHTLNGGRWASNSNTRPVTNVDVHNYSGQETTQTQTPNSTGGVDVTVMIGKAVASEAGRRGSPVNKSLSQNYNASTTLRTR